MTSYYFSTALFDVSFSFFYDFFDAPSLHATNRPKQLKKREIMVHASLCVDCGASRASQISGRAHARARLGRAPR